MTEAVAVLELAEPANRASLSEIIIML